jgi:hypothetical protein
MEELNINNARGDAHMRFDAKHVMELRATLSTSAVNRIKELGFEHCLEISFLNLGCRDLIERCTGNAKSWSSVTNLISCLIWTLRTHTT